MRPLVSKTRQFVRIAKFSPIFKEAEVLPRRLPNFGKANNFVCLTIELSFFFKHTWIKLRREKLLCSASAGSHVRCRDKIIFFPVHLTLLSMVFTMETRNTSGSFLEMPMTPTLDPATGTNSVAKRRRQDNLRPLQAWKQVSLLRSLRFQVWKAVTAVETTTQMTAKEKRK